MSESSKAKHRKKNVDEIVINKIGSRSDTALRLCMNLVEFSQLSLFPFDRRRNGGTECWGNCPKVTGLELVKLRWN